LVGKEFVGSRIVLQSNKTPGESMRVLICGGGVIGASIAYFLSCRGVEAIVIERTGLACAASGKSGGFLALDWCDGTRLEPLARRSFALHARLGQEIDGDGAIAASPPMAASPAIGSKPADAAAPTASSGCRLA